MNLGPTFHKYTLLVGQLVDHMEVDRDDGFAEHEGTLDTTDSEKNCGHHECEEEDTINSEFEADGLETTQVPLREPLKEYMQFAPVDAPRQLAGHIRISPTIQQARAALTDLKQLLQPRRQTGPGYKDPNLDLWTRKRLEGMQSMLLLYTDSKSKTYDDWSASSWQTAIGMKWGGRCARRLRELCRAFIADRKILPVNPYGAWNESMLADEDLQNEISIYLLSIGNQISAKKLMEFLDQPDIKERHGIEKSISHKTACRYLNSLGYRYKATPKGQYTDGHERDDVVAYRDKVFLPKWRQIQERMATWDENLVESAPSGSVRRTIT